MKRNFPQVGCGKPFVFFNDTAPTEIYALSLHDALPIFVTCATVGQSGIFARPRADREGGNGHKKRSGGGRRPTSNHDYIASAFFCSKKTSHTPRGPPPALV